jgi:hypothetical protein
MEDVMKERIFAIHQPNYIPYIGYFYKMACCDIFVYLDVVQFPRGGSFAPRNRIKTSHGSVYLTIPISRPSGRKGRMNYSEVSFANTAWKQKHLKTIRMNYSRAPYFHEVFTIYESILESGNEFVDLNIRLIEAFAKYLSISTKQVRLSEILSNFGRKTDLIIDIGRAVDADVYLSGSGGGRDYNDEYRLNANGIQLVYSDFTHPDYKQQWGKFIPNLSIIDLLFNHGPESTQVLLKK